MARHKPAIIAFVAAILLYLALPSFIYFLATNLIKSNTFVRFLDPICVSFLFLLSLLFTSCYFLRDFDNVPCLSIAKSLSEKGFSLQQSLTQATLVAMSAATMMTLNRFSDADERDSDLLRVLLFVFCWFPTVIMMLLVTCRNEDPSNSNSAAYAIQDTVEESEKVSAVGVLSNESSTFQTPIPTPPGVELFHSPLKNSSEVRNANSLSTANQSQHKQLP